MAGIITDAMSSTNPYTAPGVAAAQPADPTKWAVTNNMTVQGQLAGIMDPNNPLMQQAQTQGQQISANRGLANSSMAATGGQSAMYTAATPIATSDATMFGNAASGNATNATSLSNAATQAASSKYATDVGAATSIANAATQAASSKYGADVGASSSKYGTDVGATTSIANTATQAASSKYGTDVGATTSVGNTTAQIAAAAALQTAGAKSALELQKQQQDYDLLKTNVVQAFNVSNMDHAAAITLGQMTTQQQNDIAKLATAQGYNLATLTAQQVNDLAKMTVTQTNMVANMGTQQGFDIAKMDKSAAASLTQLTTQQQGDLAKLAKANDYTVANMSAQQVNDMVKLTTNNAATAAVQAAHDANTTTLQNSAGAQKLFNDYINDVASINSNPAIADKTAAITNVAKFMQSGLDAYTAGKLPDVTKLLDEMNKVVAGGGGDDDVHASGTDNGVPKGF